MLDQYKERDGRLKRLRASPSGEKIPESAIKARREELGMSQHELARASGLSQPVISRIEAGTQLLMAAASQKLGAALKRKPHDLGLAENLSLMRRLAVKGRLDSKAAVSIALHLLQTQPESEAGRRVNDAAIAAMADIAEAAAENYVGGKVALKIRDERGRQIDDPLSLKKRRDEPLGSRRDVRGRRVKLNLPGQTERELRRRAP